MRIDPSPELRLERRFDSALSGEERTELAELLQEAFGDFFKDRLFFKQVPHERLLLKSAGRIVGQCGLDYRIMRADEAVIYTLGAVDLCVLESRRGRGLGVRLMRELLAVARERCVDHAILVSHDGRLYRRLGFTPLTAEIRWLAVEELRSVAVLQEWLSDEIHSLPIRAAAPLKARELDFLGYMF